MSSMVVLKEIDNTTTTTTYNDVTTATADGALYYSMAAKGDLGTGPYSSIIKADSVCAACKTVPGNFK